MISIDRTSLLGITRRLRVFLAAMMFLALPLRASAQEQVEYYGTDALGSIRIVFNADGSVKGRTDFGPYGEELTPALGQAVYAQLFRDGESGQDYAEARMYQPRTGRFNAPDPVYDGLFDPQRWNRYSYAHNNPIAFIDPSGLDECNPPRPFCYGSNTSNPPPLPPPSDDFGWLFGGANWFCFMYSWACEPSPIPVAPISEPEPPGGGLFIPQPSPAGPVISPVPDPTPPARPGSAGACNPITLEGCAPPPKKTNAFFKGVWESTKALFSSSGSESCLVLFGRETVENLFPLAPSAASFAEPAAAFGAAVQFNRALQYAASRPNSVGGTGLMYPFKSSVFRSMVGTAGKISNWGSAAGMEALAMGQALWAESAAWQAGQCR